MLSYIRDNIIPDMVSSIRDTIRMGGEKNTFGCDNYATACDEFEYRDISCEVFIKVKYTEYGCADSFNEPYSIDITDISITYDYGDGIQYINPEEVGITNKSFEV